MPKRTIAILLCLWPPVSNNEPLHLHWALVPFDLVACRMQNWVEAIHWYNCALNMMDYDEGGEFDGMQDEPRYLLLAREAEMYMSGGFGLQPDPQRSGKGPSVVYGTRGTNSTHT